LGKLLSNYTLEKGLRKLPYAQTNMERIRDGFLSKAIEELSLPFQKLAAKN
jgi:hypothetical protein